MARLLVSVRSAREATAALAGGASIIDVKEPDRGALGCADVSVWSEVRAVVGPRIPVSAALGELSDWDQSPFPSPSAFAPLAFRKLGLAGAGPDWAARWSRLRANSAGGPPWIAVVYADWRRAEAPAPSDVIDVALALALDDCAGVLFDTWSKTHPSPIDATWTRHFDRVRESGRFTALAGGLDLSSIPRLASLRPDVVAVRGAACESGDRRAAISSTRVAALSRLAADL